MMLRTASRLPRIRKGPQRLLSSAKNRKNPFQDPEMYLSESELANRTSSDPFGLPKSSCPKGRFENALESKTENIYDEARTDYIHRYGRAQPDPDLVRAYLRQDLKTDPNPASALSLKAFGLKDSPGDPLLEARLLDKRMPGVKGIHDASPYAQSLLAELIEHPMLNADIGEVLELDGEDRAARIKELEEFYGKTVQELLAFMEFKKAKREMEEVNRQGAEELGRGHGPGLVDESLKKQLEFFENGGLGRFFDPMPESTATLDENLKTYVEMEPLDEERFENIKAQLSAKNERYEEIGRDFKEPVDHDPEDGPFQFRTYAYERPRYYKDAKRQIYGRNYGTNEWIPERNKIFPTTLGHRESPTISANEMRTERLPELKLSELMNRLKSGNETEENLLALYKEIYNRLDMMDRLPPQNKSIVRDGAGQGKRSRSDGWVVQEMIRSRIALDSTKFWAMDQIQRKGAFSQLDSYKAGVALEEQTAVGSLYWTDKKELKLAQKRLKDSEFKRNLKRRIEEFLQETSISDLGKRKEMFLAIEKSGHRDEYPAEQMTQAQHLALISHPFALDYLSAMTHPKVIDKISISKPELLSNFLDLVRISGPGARAIYADFFQIFTQDSVNSENASKIISLVEMTEPETKVTGMTVFWLKRLLAMRAYNSLKSRNLGEGPSVKTTLSMLKNYLTSLGQITVHFRRVLQMPINPAKLTESPSKCVFFTHLWTSSSAVDGLRLILLANTVWNLAERGDNPWLLILQFSSTFEKENIEKVFSEEMHGAMKKAGLDAAADRVRRAVDLVYGLIDRLEVDPIFEFETDWVPNLADHSFFDFETECFVAGGRPLMKEFKRSLRDLSNEEYKRLQPVIECLPISKKLRRYQHFHSFYHRRHGSPLPSIYEEDGSISEVTLTRNLSTLSDFYTMNVKRKVLDSDYDDNQKFRTTGVRWKLEGKGLTRNTSVVRNFSKKKDVQNAAELRVRNRKYFTNFFGDDDEDDDDDDMDKLDEMLSINSQNNVFSITNIDSELDEEIQENAQKFQNMKNNFSREMNDPLENENNVFKSRESINRELHKYPDLFINNDMATEIELDNQRVLEQKSLTRVSEKNKKEEKNSKTVHGVVKKYVSTKTSKKIENDTDFEDWIPHEFEDIRNISPDFNNLKQHPFERPKLVDYTEFKNKVPSVIEYKRQRDSMKRIEFEKFSPRRKFIYETLMTDKTIFELETEQPERTDLEIENENEYENPLDMVYEEYFQVTTESQKNRIKNYHILSPDFKFAGFDQFSKNIQNSDSIQKFLFYKQTISDSDLVDLKNKIKSKLETSDFIGQQVLHKRLTQIEEKLNKSLKLKNSNDNQDAGEGNGGLETQTPGTDNYFNKFRENELSSSKFLNEMMFFSNKNLIFFDRQDLDNYLSKSDVKFSEEENPKSRNLFIEDIMTYNVFSQKKFANARKSCELIGRHLEIHNIDAPSKTNQLSSHAKQKLEAIFLMNASKLSSEDLCLLALLSRSKILERSKSLFSRNQMHSSELNISKESYLRLKSVMNYPDVEGYEWGQLFLSSLLDKDSDRSELFQLKENRDWQNLNNIQVTMYQLVSEIEDQKKFGDEGKESSEKLYSDLLAIQKIQENLMNNLSQHEVEKSKKRKELSKLADSLENNKEVLDQESETSEIEKVQLEELKIKTQKKMRKSVKTRMELEYQILKFEEQTLSQNSLDKNKTSPRSDPSSEIIFGIKPERKLLDENEKTELEIIQMKQKEESEPMPSGMDLLHYQFKDYKFQSEKSEKINTRMNELKTELSDWEQWAHFTLENVISTMDRDKYSPFGSDEFLKNKILSERSEKEQDHMKHNAWRLRKNIEPTKLVKMNFKFEMAMSLVNEYITAKERLIHLTTHGMDNDIMDFTEDEGEILTEDLELEEDNLDSSWDKIDELRSGVSEYEENESIMKLHQTVSIFNLKKQDLYSKLKMVSREKYIEDKGLVIESAIERHSFESQMKQLEYSEGRSEFLSKLARRIVPGYEDVHKNLGIVPKVYMELLRQLEPLMEAYKIPFHLQDIKFRTQHSSLFPNGRLVFANRRIEEEKATESQRLEQLAHFPLLTNWLQQYQTPTESLKNILQIMALPEWIENLEEQFENELGKDFDDTQPISPKRIFRIYETWNRLIRDEQMKWEVFRFNLIRFRKEHSIYSFNVENFKQPFVLADDYDWKENKVILPLEKYFDEFVSISQQVYSFESRVDASALNFMTIFKKNLLSRELDEVEIESPGEYSRLLSTGKDSFYRFEEEPEPLFEPNSKGEKHYNYQKMKTARMLVYQILEKGNFKFLNKLIFKNAIIGGSLREVREAGNDSETREYQFEEENYKFTHRIRGTLLEKNLNRFLMKDHFSKGLGPEFVMVALHIACQNPELNYNRKFVKGLMLNLFYSKSKNSRELLEHVMPNFLKLIKDRKSPVILLEVCYFALKNEYQFSKTLLTSIIETLSLFPHLRGETLELGLDICKRQVMVLEFSQACYILEDTCRRGQFDLFDKMYNKIRFTLSSTHYEYDSSIEAEENKVKEEEFKIEMEEINAEWLSGLFDITVRYQIKEKREILYQELKVNQNLRSPRDLVNVLELSMGNSLLFKEVYEEILSFVIFEDVDREQVENEKIQEAIRRGKMAPQQEESNPEDKKTTEGDQVETSEAGEQKSEAKAAQPTGEGAGATASKEESKAESKVESKEESKVEGKVESKEESKVTSGTETTQTKTSENKAKASSETQNEEKDAESDMITRRKKEFKVTNDLAKRVFPMLMKHKEFLGFKLMRLYWLFVGYSDHARTPEVVREMLIYFEWLRTPLKFERYFDQFKEK